MGIVPDLGQTTSVGAAVSAASKRVGPRPAGLFPDNERVHDVCLKIGVRGSRFGVELVLPASGR